MEQQQNEKSKWVEIAVKLALSFAIFFPIYLVLYVTFPGSIVAFYLISSVLFAVFAPWDDWKKRFLS